MPANNPTMRTQDANEQPPSNPFDVIIKKSKFPGRIQ